MLVYIAHAAGQIYHQNKGMTTNFLCLRQQYSDCILKHGKLTYIQYKYANYYELDIRIREIETEHIL